ncbi:MAG: acetolactate synthase [Bacteroidales bacterium]|jgi:hypothetical protein|nr:acetolactate synthase [Bacteroidales bacterium]
MNTIKQLSIFLENRLGTLQKVLEALQQQNIEIQAVSVADTSDYGILRLITSDQFKAEQLLKHNGILANINEVFAIKIDSNTGAFSKAVNCLTEKGIEIKYLYTFSLQNKLVLIVRVDKLEAAEAVLTASGLELVKGWE